MSSKVASLLNIKTVPTDIKKVLNLDITSLKGCDEEIAKVLKQNKISKISDLIKITSSDKLVKSVDSLKLEKLTTAARIINELATGERSTDKKIVIAGIDNAGKTSIIHTLTNPKTVKEGKQEKPTKGLEFENINLFGFNLSLWDLGGQEIYRKKYMDEPKYHFGYTNLFVYVIDMSDTKRIQDSLEYLSKIVEIYRYLEESPISIVLLHKADLLKQKGITKAKSEIAKTLPKIFKNIKFTTFITSIYDFNSLFSAFSEGLRELSPVNTIIKNILIEFESKVNAKYISFYNETGICIAENGVEQKDLVKNFAFNTILGEELNIFPKEASKLILALNNKTYCILERIVTKDKEKFFLAYISPDNPEFVTKEPLILEMKPWLDNFF
ncbi:MAG: ADP-ribosylation factor-like protein [Candidatus Helarchaeota archaeon]